MENNLERLVLQLFDIQVVKFGNFKLKSGVQSPVYFDLRIIVSYPKLMDLLTSLLVELIQSSVVEKFQHVCGVPYTALPMATLVSAKSGTPMLIRRREAKDHGTRKMVEGQFSQGDECIIIEDVVSSGSSILETVKDLQKEGLKASHAIVVLDREQGGLRNLEEQGINVHVLMNLTKVLKILLKHEKITVDMAREAEEYISRVKLFSKGEKQQCANGLFQTRLRMSFADRAKLAKNDLTRRVFEVMESKKTLLCVAADVPTMDELLQLAADVGPHVCILKTHFDAVQDFSSKSRAQLVSLAKTHNFLIMEDRKFSDIGNTVCLQYEQIKSWANLVTTHSIGGEAVLKGLKSCVGSTEESRGCFLVAELSCQGHLITKEYANATTKMAEDHSDFVVGLVCQSPELVRVPYLIQLTPGVKIEEGTDGLGQNYSGPDYAVLEKGADVVVVGRGITSSSNPKETAIMYKERLWKAYQKRITAV